MAKHSLRFTLFLFFSDVLLVALALELASLARTHIPLGRPGSAATWAFPLPVYLVGALTWGATFAALNVYSARHMLYIAVELVKVIEATVFAWLILAGGLYFTYREISRLEYVYFLALYLGLVTAHRVAVRAWFRLQGGHRYHMRRVLIVGTGEIACDVASMIQAHVWMGLVPVGFVDDGSGAAQPCGLPVLGTLDQTHDVIAQHGISEVVIALSRQAAQDQREFVFRLQSLPVNIRLIPDYFDMAFLRVNIEDFGGMPLLALKEPALDPFQRLVKRVFDLMVVSLLMVPVLPLMGLLALLIKRDSPGPALFRQQRVGEGGRLFTMYKFRTMLENAENLQAQVATLDDEGNIIHKHADDPRITRVGRWLRRLSLDELPQLFNILRGQMSLVGPRPEMPWLVEQYEAWQRKRFEVPQGLTGWWQINGRADKPMHLHTEDDLYYIRNYSVWLDLKILWRTVQVVLLRRGAF